jgi:hypothetical protein
MPELTLPHFIADFNSHKRTKNLGSGESHRVSQLYLKSADADGHISCVFVRQWSAGVHCNLKVYLHNFSQPLKRRTNTKYNVLNLQALG